jgi:hypothetical protein
MYHIYSQSLNLQQLYKVDYQSQVNICNSVSNTIQHQLLPPFLIQSWIFNNTDSFNLSLSNWLLHLQNNSFSEPGYVLHISNTPSVSCHIHLPVHHTTEMKKTVHNHVQTVTLLVLNSARLNDCKIRTLFTFIFIQKQEVILYLQEKNNA